MLLTGYKKNIFRPKCNPGFESVHCIATLNEDISEVLPYLNAVLGGTQYYNDPPQVVFHHYGKIIKVSGKEIAINALKDEEEADKILEWLKREINNAWENKDKITPSYKGQEKPVILEVLKYLPKTNCKKCGLPTCMVFAVQVCEGAKSADDCPDISVDNKEKLSNYLSKFNFD